VNLIPSKKTRMILLQAVEKLYHYNTRSSIDQVMQCFHCSLFLKRVVAALTRKLLKLVGVTASTDVYSF